MQITWRRRAEKSRRCEENWLRRRGHKAAEIRLSYAPNRKERIYESHRKPCPHGGWIGFYGGFACGAGRNARAAPWQRHDRAIPKKRRGICICQFEAGTNAKVVPPIAGADVAGAIPSV